ncbi:related to Crg1 protein (Putative arabinase) [Pseudozyma flocculosa]|uniref:Related to Crg1 protein (Putative arabinase) n=1 Tax=Pseudozyma flocculosa TaxID=84751 RepID=A0A5C3FBA3_9BASI|nr:related to Crg1 protein (Putative arabinase) [Pseudozyma flocculosa]
MRLLLLTSLLSLALAALASPIAQQQQQPAKARAAASDKVGYFFVHFHDDYKSPGDYSTYPAGEQVFGQLSNGNNAISYTALKGGAPLLTSTVGTKGVRDMYLVSKPDESQHYIIATDLNQTAVGGFGGKFLSRSLVIWDSEGPSLTKWKAPRLVEVVPPEFRMAWAPEAMWIEERKSFMVYWSSNKYADASHSGTPDYDKIYRAYTTDFRSFTQPEVYIDLGAGTGVIDLTMHPTGQGNQYVRFFKDESVSKCRGQVSNSGIDGQWNDIGSAKEYVDNNNQSEGECGRRLRRRRGVAWRCVAWRGAVDLAWDTIATDSLTPCLVLAFVLIVFVGLSACLFFKDNLSDKWWVFLDQYGRNPPGYYPYTADKGITQYGYTDLGFPPGMPKLLKHGAVKPVNQAQYDEIKAAWG